jgi:integrase
VLSPEEVTRLIDAAGNLYHRTLLMTLYSTAMRRAELCRLKVQDIDSQRMMIRIHQGKGGRDREVPLSPKLLETLRVYFRWMRPTTFTNSPHCRDAFDFLFSIGKPQDGGRRLRPYGPRARLRGVGQRHITDESFEQRRKARRRRVRREGC